MTCLLLWAWQGDIKQEIKTFQESENFDTVSSIKGAGGRNIAKTWSETTPRCFFPGFGARSSEVGATGPKPIDKGVLHPLFSPVSLSHILS